MRMVDLISKKRDGKSLTEEEIRFAVDGYTNGSIPDYQMSSFLMAVYFQDMNDEERAHLTMAMVESGDQIDLSQIEGVKVDKHSTGGVGDTTTLVLGPLVAALGVPVAKMSGRGLGHTGGTIDKLEAVEGFNVEITENEFIDLVNKNKIAIVGQSGNLTPADKKMYALRDVTGSVNSIPLIASSIMSKKIASGADAIVLDVKVGDGAFMKDESSALALAKAMVSIGNNVGRRTMAIISSMEEPLGYAIGNGLEVKEAIDTLSGQGPKDLTELCIELGAQMLVVGEKFDSIEEAKDALHGVIEDGSALEKLKVFLSAQGGDASVIDTPEHLPTAKYQIEVNSDVAGYVERIDAEGVGVSSAMLGAGRQTKEDDIDFAVGIVLNKKVGDKVEVNDTLAVLHANTENVDEVIQKVKSHYHIGSNETSIELIKTVIHE